MKRIIKIFLASSITEFANERMMLENFIRNISDKFEEHYDVKIQPLLCENLDDAYTVGRKQEEYNEKIRDSELCFFIFFTKVGQYTREEFNVAKEQFEKSGKPKIYTYFKILEEGDKAEQSLYDFMNELDKLLGHYYGKFTHIDTVKLRILLSLKLQEMDFLEIKSDNGQCVVDGVGVLSLDNVSEFANNKNLIQLQNELRKIDEKYQKLKPIYAKGGCDSNIYSHYSKIATKRQSLIEEITELQKLIFNISLRMTHDEIRGDITPRQKEAYRLFELGDYEGCMSVLDSEEIDSDFLRERKRIKEQEIAICKKYIREHKTAIDILTSMTGYPERFEEIEKRYEKILPIIFEQKIELDTVFDYAYYLGQQKNYKRAKEIVTRLDKYSISQKEKIKVQLLLGSIFSNHAEYEEAEKHYIMALHIATTLKEEKNCDYDETLAEIYNDIGTFYMLRSHSDDDSKMAIICLVNAVEKREVLFKTNREKVYELIKSYNNLANCFFGKEDYYNAIKYSLKNQLILKQEVDCTSDKYLESLMINSELLGRCHLKQGEFKQAKQYLSKAVELAQEFLFKNPKAYEDLFYQICIALCEVYKRLPNLEEASKYCIMALKTNCVFKYNLDDMSYFNELAESCFNAGIKKAKQNKALRLYQNAAEIYEVLAEDKYKIFGIRLASCYYNIGCVYALTNEKKDLDEKYFLKAIKIAEELAKENPREINRYLAIFYYGFLNSCDSVFIQFKALKFAKRHPEIPMCKNIISMLE